MRWCRPARLRRAPTPDAARELVAETLRIDPPIHNTRRFLTDEINVDGQRIAAGQTVLLVLAAAALAQPDTPWTFGALGHACPGQDLARRGGRCPICAPAPTRPPWPRAIATGRPTPAFPV